MQGLRGTTCGFSSFLFLAEALGSRRVCALQQKCPSVLILCQGKLEVTVLLLLRAPVCLRRLSWTSVAA